MISTIYIPKELQPCFKQKNLLFWKIEAHILARKGYKGVPGTYKFNALGDGLHSVSIVKIEGGKPRLIKLVEL